MKVVQLITQMESGGAQRIAYLLGDALERRGHQSEIWFLYRKRPAYDHVPNVRVLAESKPPLRSLPRLLSQLREQLALSAPDALITHTWYANILGQGYARWLGIRKRIAVQHGLARDYPPLARFFDYLVGCTDTYTTNVAVSQSVSASFSKYPSPYLKRLRTIPNGVPSVVATSSAEETRRTWGLPQHSPVLANVGRLSKIKNQTVLLDVLARLSDVHLVLVGAGEEQKELEQKAVRLQVADRVHMVGEIAHQHAINLIAASDVFVFPSRSESMGLAAIEAMMCGTPIVASHIRALHEVLGPDSAVYAAPDDADGLAEAVRQILDTPTLAKKISAASSAHAPRFSMERMVTEYEQVLALLN